MVTTKMQDFETSPRELVCDDEIWGPEGQPLVTVIICGFNDESNIVNAIRSVLNQTLHATEAVVVDDCSTDATFDRASAIANEEPRVRVFRTEHNSGGPGAPRNVGLEKARGAFVMFLDSDDVLERHASYNLLRTAEASQSELTMGRTGRFEVATNRHYGWHARLYREEAHYSSIEDNPEMAIDTISVAKLYRRDFIDRLKLRFPENMHYEDLIFTAEAFAGARGISVIPEKVYQWNVYPVKVRKSITSQRDDIKNLQHRKLALKRVMELAPRDVVPNLHDRLQLKIIRHDARLYLNDIADKTYRSIAPDVLAELRDLILSVPEHVVDLVPTPERLLLAAALAKDVDLVVRMINVARGVYDLYGQLASEVDLSLWEPSVFGQYATGSFERRLATFDPRELTDIPWYNFKWFNRVDKVTIDANNLLTVKGETPDSFSKFAVGDVSARVVIRERWGHQREWTAPFKFSRTDGGWIKWAVEFQFPDEIDLAIRPKISIRLELSDGVSYSLQPLRAKQKFAGSRQMTTPKGMLQKASNVRYQPYATVAGTLALRSARINKRRRKLREYLNPVLARRSARLRDQYDPLEQSVRATEGARIIGSSKDAIDEHLVVVESHMGTSQFDSPRDVVDELKKARPDLKVIWSAAQNQRWTPGRDDIVVRHTVDYYRTLAKARFIIDNQSLPDGFVKRPGQTYLQTWHGIPIKRMGFDEDSIAFAPAETAENLQRKIDYWDYLSVPSPYFKETFVPAYRYQGELLPLGSPRNDILVKEGADTAAAKARLGVDPNRSTVLYAPTFRKPGRTSLELDLKELVESLGDDVQVMLRPHYLNRIKVPDQYRANVVDVSAVGDTARVLLATDVLVSDYSSIIFDFLSLDRPVILYTFDFEDYVSSARGTYFDLRSHRPGPLVATQEELVDTIREVVGGSDRFAGERRAFRDRFAGVEPGDSALTTVATIWGGK
ncbi:bifunctional glycosyltransferase/CDP-glycerol:glycerophosphate glycerophosphotransferase [Brevibacterium aurantiacum]|uniref:bifunctional glycosyltransferase/CDP-glycerol:glycerophosphate glycerophosphotransferase n=1 Tax=Brevibacterium aurantiacum TaxID=273384 RepID=UPI000F631828|nr:CDP-glycerol glycerophosphotransferase family protein [Brevibacterium aurantiacum]